jgi:hypothetical protein
MTERREVRRVKEQRPVSVRPSLVMHVELGGGPPTINTRRVVGADGLLPELLPGDGFVPVALLKVGSLLLEAFGAMAAAPAINGECATSRREARALGGLRH